MFPAGFFINFFNSDTCTSNGTRSSTRMVRGDGRNSNRTKPSLVRHGGGLEVGLFVRRALVVLGRDQRGR